MRGNSNIDTDDSVLEGMRENQKAQEKRLENEKTVVKNFKAKADKFLNDFADGKIDAATTYEKLELLQESVKTNSILNSKQKAEVDEYIDKIKSDIVDYLHGEKDIETSQENISETENNSAETKKAAVKVTGDEFGEYENIKELRQKAIQYYKENLQGTSVENKTLGKIDIDENGLVEFTTAGRKKVESTSALEQKLLLVKHLPNLIENATDVKKSEPIKERHKDDIFYYLENTAEIDGENIPVHITLVKHNTGRIQFYNHSIEKEDTSVNSAIPNKIGNSPVDVSSAENIPQKQEGDKEELYKKFQVDKFPVLKEAIDKLSEKKIKELVEKNLTEKDILYNALNLLEEKYPKVEPTRANYDEYHRQIRERLSKRNELEKQSNRKRNPISAEQAYQEFEKFLKEKSVENSNQKTSKVKENPFADLNLKELSIKWNGKERVFMIDGKKVDKIDFREVSTIANPRRINFFCNPHFAVYYENCSAINENGKNIKTFYNNPPTVEKIVMNHYSAKSREEFINKVKRGTADANYNVYKYEEENYTHDTEENKIFDDRILKYRDARKEFFNLGGGF